MVDLRVLKSRKLAIAASLTFVLGFALFATVFIVPVFTQRLLGYPAMKTGMLFLPGAITNRVMLCEGTVVVIELLAMATLPSEVMVPWLAEAICQACAVPVVGKFARLTDTGVLPCCLLITMTVSAWSEERTAANDER